MNRWLLVMLCGLFAAGWLLGCDEDDDPVEPVYRDGLELLETPSTLLANIDSVYTVRARVTDEGVTPEAIECLVTLPDKLQQSFLLFDDGSLFELQEHPFAGAPSGDVTPSNGTYTRTINGASLANGQAGDFLFAFSVPGQSDPIYEQQVTIPAANIHPCVLESVPPAVDLNECYDPVVQSIELATTEPDAVDSLRAILLLDGAEQDTLELAPGLSDTIWDATLTPSSFPCAGTDDGYSIRYEAKTQFGLTCEQVTADFSILNDDPELFLEVGLPDTIVRPTAVSDTDTIAISVRLDDCNLLGLVGYNGVRFDVSVGGGEFGSGEDFVFNDGGVAGDTVAGDGIYTVGLRFWRDDTIPDNEYVLRYYAIECAPPFVQTDYIFDTVQVIQPDADSITFPEPSGERGFDVVKSPPLPMQAIAGGRR